MAYGLFHATFIIYRTTLSRLAPSSTTGTLFNYLNIRKLKQDDLAAAFSTTSLTELEQNYSSWLVVENNEFIRGKFRSIFILCKYSFRR